MPFELEEDAYLLPDLEADYRFQRGVDLVGRYVPRAVLRIARVCTPGRGSS